MAEFRNRVSLLLAVVAGVLLIISGSSGGTGVWGAVLQLIIDEIGGVVGAVAGGVLTVLAVLASLGGVTVIVGGFCIYFSRITTGRLLNSIGASMGIIGLLIAFISAVAGGWVYLISLAAGLLTTVGGLGVLLSVVSSVVSKKS